MHDESTWQCRAVLVKHVTRQRAPASGQEGINTRMRIIEYGCPAFALTGIGFSCRIGAGLAWLQEITGPEQVEKCLVANLELVDHGVAEDTVARPQRFVFVRDE